MQFSIPTLISEPSAAATVMPSLGNAPSDHTWDPSANVGDFMSVLGGLTNGPASGQPAPAVNSVTSNAATPVSGIDGASATELLSATLSGLGAAPTPPQSGAAGGTASETTSVVATQVALVDSDGPTPLPTTVFGRGFFRANTTAAFASGSTGQAVGAVRSTGRDNAQTTDTVAAGDLAAAALAVGLMPTPLPIPLGTAVTGGASDIPDQADASGQATLLGKAAPAADQAMPSSVVASKYVNASLSSDAPNGAAALPSRINAEPSLPGLAASPSILNGTISVPAKPTTDASGLVAREPRLGETEDFADSESVAQEKPALTAAAPSFRVAADTSSPLPQPTGVPIAPMTVKAALPSSDASQVTASGTPLSASEAPATQSLIASSSVVARTAGNEAPNPAPVRSPAANQNPSAQEVAEKFAANADMAASVIEPKKIGPFKTLLAIRDQRVESGSPGIGIASAKSDATMPAGSLFERSVTSVDQPAAVAANVKTEAVIPQPVALPSTAHRAVEAVLDATERFASRDQHSVNLQFTVGGSDLTVRVELRGSEVHTTFRTDSAELRAALSSEWQSVTRSGAEERSVRLASPVFTTSDSSTNSSAGDQSRRQQAAPQDRASSSAAFSRGSSTSTAGSAVSHDSAPTRTAASNSRHLHTLA